MRATDEEIRQRGLQQPDTADMRNKVAGKATAARAVQAVRDLGAKILTKVGPAQRADAIKRGAEAIWGTDPEFRTYQDSPDGIGRHAGGGTAGLTGQRCRCEGPVAADGAGCLPGHEGEQRSQVVTH